MIRCPTTEDGIHIDSVREYVPRFKRVYSARINERATIKIEIYSANGLGRMKSGELTQPNGRWVLFDPDAIANQILDPILVPLVQRYVDAVYTLDKQFLSSDPGYFTDERGVKWQRVEK